MAQNTPPDPSTPAPQQNTPAQSTTPVADFLRNRWRSYASQNGIQNRPDVQRYLRSLSFAHQGAEARRTNTTFVQPTTMLPTFWEVPQNIARMKNTLDTLPPGTSAPSWVDPQGINSAYEWISTNYGPETEKWPEDLGEFSPISDWLRSLTPPPATFDVENAQATLFPADPAASLVPQPTFEPLGVAGINPSLGFYRQPNTTEGGLAVPGVTDASREAFNSQLGAAVELLGVSQGAPWIQKALSTITPAVGVVGGALPLAILGGLLGPWGFAAGAAIGLGGSIAAMLTEQGRQQKAMEQGSLYKPGVLTQILNVFDIPALWVEQLAGTTWQLVASSLAPEDYGSVQSVLQNLPAAWEASRGFYENLILPVGLGKDEYEVGGRDVFRTYEKGANGDWQTVSWRLPEGVDSAPAFLLSQAADQIGDRLMNGERPKDVYMDIEQQYYDVLGSAAAARDLVGHIILDPLNLTNSIFKRVGMRVMAKKGNLFGAQAFMLGRGEAIQTARIYGALLQQGVTQEEALKLSRWERWLGGFDENGQSTILKPRVLSKNKLKAIFQSQLGFTPEAQADTVVTMSLNNMRVLLSEARNVDEIMQLLQGAANLSPQLAAAASEKAPWLKAAVGQVFPMAMRDLFGEKEPLAVLISAWHESRGNVAFLDRMASVLGESTHDMLKEIKQHGAGVVLQRFFTGLEEMANKGDQNALTLLNQVRGKLTPEQLEATTLPFIKGTIPLTFDNMRAAVANVVMEHIGKWAADYYGVKPTPLALQVSNLIRQVQSLILLGTSPSYTFQNLYGNVVTMAYSGIYGTVSMNEIRRFNEEWMGVTPARMEAGAGPAAALGQNAASKEIRAAARPQGNGLLSKLNDIMSRANRSMVLTPTMQMSQRFEQMNSAQAVHNGMVYAWNRLWKPGTGFDRMPPVLEAALAEIDPALPGAVYAAIQGGAPSKDLVDALWAEVKGKPANRALRSFVADAAQRGEITDPDGVLDMMRQLGIEDRLNQALKDAKTPEEAGRALDLFQEDVIRAMTDEIAKHQKDIAENAMTRGVAEGPQAALEVADFFLVDIDEFWSQHFQDWGEVMIELRGTKDRATRNRLIYRQRQESGAKWHRITEIQKANMTGLLRGLQTDETHVQRMTTIMDRIAARWQRFYNEVAVIQDRFDPTGMKPEEFRTASDAIKAETDAMYKSAFDEVSAMYDEVDQIFIQAYQTQFDMAGPAAEAWRKGVKDSRKAMHDAIQKAKKEINALGTQREREMAWDRFWNGEYRTLTQKLMAANLDGAKKMFVEIAGQTGTPILTPGTTKPINYTIRQMNDLFYQYNIPRSEIQYMLREINQFVPDGEPKFEMIDLMVTPSEATYKRLEAALAKWDADRQTRETARPTPPPPPAPAAGAPVEPAPLGAPSPMIMTAFSNDDYVPETVIYARAADIPGSSVGEEYIVRITKAQAPGRKGRAMIVRVLDDADPRIAESKFGEISETFKDNTLQERLDAIFVANSNRRSVVNLESLREEDVLAMGFTSKMDAKRRVSVGLGKDIRHLAEITLEDLKRVAPKVDEIVDDAQAQVGQALDAREKAGRQLGYQNGMSGADVRAAFLDDAQEIMGLSKEEAAAVIALMDGRAGVWARKNGSTADTWWSNNIAGIVDSVDEYVRSKYFNAQAPAQGASTLLNDGRTLISALIKPNVTTLVHEVAHIFFRELDDVERKIFSDWYMQQYHVKVTWDGTKFVPETPGAKLVAGWIRGKPELSVEDHMAEAFAYGYENHIHRGVRSETPVGIAAVYEALSNWFRDIYKKIVGSNISVPISDEVRKMMDGLVDDGYEPRRPVAEPEVAPGGPRVEAPERTPEIERAVEDAVTRTSDDLAAGRSTGLADAVRVGDGDVDSNTARKDVQVLDTLGQVRETNPIDDVQDQVVFNHQRTPLSERPLGAEVEGYEGDPNKTFKMHYQVVDLYDILPSHDEYGRPYAGYPKGRVYQMRGRGRKAYVVELQAIRGKFNVNAPLEVGPSISTGSIVVDRNGYVLSGNGRTAVWHMLARDNSPVMEKYLKKLRKNIAKYGLDESALEGIEHPILVRVLDDGQDVADFTYLANQGAVSRLSPVEKALSDARWIDRRAMAALDIGDNETLEAALGRTGNGDFVRSFMNALPRTERNELVDADGVISPAGIKRITNAMFARLFSGPDGERMLAASLESDDPGIKAIRAALSSSLGQLAAMEEHISLGHRNRGLTIAKDIGAVVNLLADVKKSGTTIDKFLKDMAPADQGRYSPFQIELAHYMEEHSKESAVLRRFLRDYVEEVNLEPAPDEVQGLFGERTTRTRGEILDDIMDAPEVNALADEVMKREAAAGQRPRPRQVVINEIKAQRDADGTSTTRFYVADARSKTLADQAYAYAAIRTYGSVGDAIQALTAKANSLQAAGAKNDAMLSVIGWLQDEVAKSGNDTLVQRAIDDGKPKSFFQRPLAKPSVDPETLDGMQLFGSGDDPLFQRGLREDYSFLGDEYDSNDFRVGFRKSMVDLWGIKDKDLLDSIMFMMDSISKKWSRKNNRPAEEYWSSVNGAPVIAPPETAKGAGLEMAYMHGAWDKATDYGPYTIGLQGIPVGAEQGFANFSFMHEVAHASKLLLDGNEMGLVLKWLSDTIGSEVIIKGGMFQQLSDSSHGGPAIQGLYVYSPHAEELWATAVSAYLQGGPLPNGDMRVPFARFREAIRDGMVRFSTSRNQSLALYDEYPNRFNAQYHLHQTEIPGWITPIFQDMFGTANPELTDGLTPGNPFIRYSKRITYDEWMSNLQSYGGRTAQLETDEQFAALGFTSIMNLLPEPSTMTQSDFMQAAAHVRDMAERAKRYTLDVVLKDASEKVRNETIREIDDRMKSISDEDFLRRYYRDQVLDAIDRDYVLDPEILDENPAFRRSHQDAIRIRNDRLEQVRGSTLYQTAPDTPEFREWFGDSKVVDEDGKPLVMYHGTATESEFLEFLPISHFGTAEQANNIFDLHPSENKRRIIPVYLSIKNPLVVDYDIGGAEIQILQEAVKQNRVNTGKAKKLIDQYSLAIKGGEEDIDSFRKEFISFMLSEGVDGVKYKNEWEGEGYSYIAFDPTQIKSAIGNRGTFDPSNPNILYQTSSPDEPWYYSPLMRTITSMPQAKMPVEQFRAWLKGRAKADELKWTGFDEWLDQQTGTVTRQDMLDYLQKNQIQVKDVILGGEKDTIAEPDWWRDDSTGISYATIDGDEYEIREAVTTDGTQLFRVSVNGTTAHTFRDYQSAIEWAPGTSSRTNPTKYKEYTIPGGENYHELLLTLPNKGDPYRSPHWNEPNILAHVRFDDRVDADGRRVLFVEEVQSDWHQAGREHGYRSGKNTARVKSGPYNVIGFPGKKTYEYEIIDSSGSVIKTLNAESEELALAEFYKYGKQPNMPPAGPFSGSWETLAMRRVIRWAAENGYDRVAWTTGKMQSERYNLSAQVDTLRWHQGEGILSGDKGNRQVFHKTGIGTREDLIEYVGVDVAEKLMAASDEHNGWRLLSGKENLTVGSSGMSGFYDQKLPSVVRKIIKPWGVDVGEISIVRPSDYLAPGTPLMHGDTVPSFDITPEMRQSVMQGQPLFQTASGDHVRVEPINGEQHAGLDIVANVYASDDAGEKLVAYMPNTYRLGGWVGEGANRYRILGVSTDREGKYWIVERADNTLTTVERNPETVAVNAPLGAAQQFQTAPPSAQISHEGYEQHLRPVLNKIRSYYTDPANWKSNKFSKLQATLPPDIDRQMRAYLAKVQGQRSSAKLATIRYGEMQRDFALLNYGAQRGFDTWLSAFFPYQFWYTRSAWHWLQRFADRPSILSKYYQLRTYGERTENDPSFPQRLKGKVAMPVPFLPEETGGTMWIDPLKQLFPFEAFARPLDMLKQDQNVLQRASASVIYGWINDGTVSKEAGMQAINSMSGTLWEKAYAAAKMDNEDQLNGGYDIMSSLLSPSLPINYLVQILKGTPERINQLPFTRGLQAMTSLLNIGKPGGVNLAESINVAGFPSVDRFYEYRVDRELSNIAAEGQITAQTAIEAMINRSGPAFDQATTRSGKLTGWKWVYAVMFPDFYTLGEQKQRQLSKEFKEAMDAWAAGKSEKIQAFYEDHPEYEARMSSLDDPEVRLRGFVIDRIWEAYKSKNSAEKKAYIQSFGKVFQQNFLDKETQDYDTIDTPTLLAWAKALGQNQLTVQKESPTLNVNLPDPESSAALDAYYKELNEKFPNIQARLDKYFATSEAARTTDPVVWSYTRWKDKYLAEHPNIIQYVQSEQSSLAGMTMEQQQVIYQYRAAKMQKFPNIDFLQDQYFKLDTTKRRAFLKDNPSLADYWDWRKSYAADYPSVATYILGQDKVSDLIRGTSGDIPLDIQKYIDAYYEMRDQYFPNMDALQDQYFKLQDTTQRKSFRKAHPEMLAYWDWRREWAAQYPKAAVYILGEDSLANYILGDSYGRVQVKRDDLSQPLQNQLAQYFALNQDKLSGPAREAVKNIWIKMGKPGADLDEFIDLYIRPLFIGG